MILSMLLFSLIFFLSIILLTLHYKEILSNRENELQMMKEDFLELALLLDQSEQELQQKTSEFNDLKSNIRHTNEQRILE